jgi:long-chain fatty acid transport protein
MHKPTFTKVGLAALLSTLSSGLLAGGFYFPEIATPGSVGTAGAANPTNTYDASSALTNPAAMVYLPAEHTLRVGFQVFAPQLEFESSIAEAGGNDGGNAGDVAAAPGVFYVRKIDEDLSVGLSLAALMGGGVDYGKNFVGRYQATKAVLTGGGLTGSVGYRVNDKLTVGASLTAINTHFEQHIAIRNPGNSDGEVKLKDLSGWSPQFAAGMTYAFDQQWLLGVVYRSKSEIDMKGELQAVNVSNPIINAAQGDIKLAFDAPEMLELGLRYQAQKDLLLFAQMTAERFSRFDNNYMTISQLNGAVRVLPRNWKDTYRLALGAVKVLPSGNFLSTGVSYDSSAVDDEDRTFDLPVDEQVRLAFSWNRDQQAGWNYSLAAELIWLGNNKIDQSAQGIRAAGEFDTSLMTIVSGSLDYRF